MKNFINILVLMFSFLSFNNLVAQEIKNETSKTEKLRESQKELKGSELNKTSTVLSIEDGLNKLNELDNRLLELSKGTKEITPENQLKIEKIKEERIVIENYIIQKRSEEKQLKLEESNSRK